MKTRLVCDLHSGFGAIFSTDRDARLDIHILDDYETICYGSIRKQVMYLLSLVSNREIPKYIESDVTFIRRD